MSSLTNEQYEVRRRFLEDLKSLSKTEHEKMFEILKDDMSDYTENSNGIFFDISKISEDTFAKLQAYMEFCRTIRKEQAERDEEERKAQDLLR